MSDAINHGGPAFPVHWPTATSKGATLRDYFMAHAPAEPQPWFLPVMASECPPYKWQGDDGTPYESAHQAEKECGDCYSNANEAAQDAWKAERQRQRYIQWPYVWADTMLMERAKAANPEG